MSTRRDGFTVVEVLAATTILAGLMVLVAELAYWSMSERARTASRQVALEVADNVLESARARAWEDLTPQWAAGLRLPDEARAELPEASLCVVVEAEKDRPHTKRVSVDVRWQREEGKPAEHVELVGLFSARAGGKR